MNNYLTAIGWWNFAGSIIMLGLFNENFGKKMMNDWCKIFKTEFVLDYWGKFWMGWAIGLNIFFGLMNILSVAWGVREIKTFLIYSDLVAYTCFFGLAIWGMKAGRTLSGIYSVFVIFGFWIVWGVISLQS